MRGNHKMPMDEVIRAIERADREDIQDILHAVMERYRELYPDWKMQFISVDLNAMDERSVKIRNWLHAAEQIFEI